jgi:hypothetical protein
MVEASLNPVAEKLAVYYRRNGYMRTQKADRIARDGWKKYKKGDEIRLVANTKRELRAIRRLLKEAGFKPGRSFPKANQYRQPVYGRREVARFLEFIGEKPQA